MKKYIMSVLVVMIVFCSSVFAEETNSYSAKLRVDNIIEMKWKLYNTDATWRQIDGTDVRNEAKYVKAGEKIALTDKNH